jgi:hypothetical protein
MLFEHDFYVWWPPQPSLHELSRELVERMAGMNVTVIYQTRVGPLVGATPIYLVVTP